MKPKTLKDLKDTNECPICGSYLECPKCKIPIKDEHFWIEYTELKAEAIKWVKYYNKHLEIRLKKFGGENALTYMTMGRIAILEKFFNITEEDLK